MIPGRSYNLIIWPSGHSGGIAGPIFLAGEGMREKTIDIQEIRELANRFSPEEIEKCIDMHLRAERHECPLTGTNEHMINELAKAGFVRQRVDTGTKLVDAIRELAERIRRLQPGEGGK